VTGDSAIDRMPRWSPDGAWLAFFSNRGGPLQLWKIRPDGSDLRRISPGQSGAAAWSPDGSQVASWSIYPDTSFILDPDRAPSEQRPIPLAVQDGFSSFNPASWSPDGAWIAGDVGAVDAGIIVYSLSSRTYMRLTEFGQWPVWLPDSRRILFVSGGNGFYVVDRETAQVRRIYASDRDVLGPPGLTRDGTTMYFSRRQTEADIWMVTLP